jgi:hypothetical protein
VTPNIESGTGTPDVPNPNSSARQRERGFLNPFQQTEWLALLELQRQLELEAMNGDRDDRDILPIVTN